MGIKHKTPKVPGEEGFAAEWNDEHLIDSDINFNSFSGINVGEPINPSDIATKNYVDSQIGPTGTYYWSCKGAAFHSYNPDVDDVIYGSYGTIKADEANINFITSVNLPHGAVVTSAIVYGSDATTVWRLKRNGLGNTVPTEMAGANINSADSSITNPTIDNNNYGYFIETFTMGDEDYIYGARITYML